MLRALLLFLVIASAPARADSYGDQFGPKALFDAAHPNDWITLWRDVDAARKALDLAKEGVPLSDDAFTYLRACRVPPRSTGIIQKQYVGGAQFFVTKPDSASCVGFVMQRHIWTPDHVPPGKAQRAAASRKPPVECKHEDAYPDGVEELLFSLTDPEIAPACKKALARFLHL